MEPEFFGLVRDALSQEPLTTERLVQSLAGNAPVAAARGGAWVERELIRTRIATRLPDGRWRLSADTDPDGDLDEEEQPPGPPRLFPARQATYATLDLETNSDRALAGDHEIIEIGLCLVKGGSVVDRYSTLVLPTRPLTDAVVELTGITDDELRRGGVPVAQALAELVARIGDTPVVAHNGFGYDFIVLDAACARAGVSPPPGMRLDLLELAHVVFPRAGESLPPNLDGTLPPARRTLDELAGALGIPATDWSQHRALGDAEVAAEVAARCLDQLNRSTALRRFQRWLLVHGGHPWGAFIDAPEEPPALDEVIDDPPEWPRIEPTGRFDPAAVVNPLRDGGALITGNRTPRGAQVQMARRVADAAAFGDDVMIEAPTGSGKTLAYLVPAVGWARAQGRCVVVATHSKVLQNQIVTTIPELESVYGEVRATLVKGRENYLSLDALEGALDGVPATADEALALAVVVGWAAMTPTGEFDDLRTWAIERHSDAFPRFRTTLRVDSSDGVASSRVQRLCFYRRAIRRMEDADLAILNHAVLISRKQWIEEPEEQRLLIVDEAHNLEDSATNALTDSVSLRGLIRLLDAIYSGSHRSGFLRHLSRATGFSLKSDALSLCRESLAECRVAVDLLTDALVSYVSDRAGARRATIERYGTTYRIRPGIDTGRPAYSGVRSASSSVGRALRQLADALDGIVVPAALRSRYRRERMESQKARLSRGLREAAPLVYEIPHCDNPLEGEWIELVRLDIAAGRWSWELSRVPVSVAAELADIWEATHATILTSATLTVAGDFGHLASRLGFGGQQLKLDTPFEDLDERHLMVLPDHLPTPRGGLLDEFTVAESDEVPRLIALADGRTLVLMTARSRLERVRDHARAVLEPLQLPLLAQGDEPSPALAERMRTDQRTSLLALRSFWEGIDVPGEALSLLAIEKLPFDPPDDPIVLARMDEVERRGKDPFADFLVPQAALRFVQGVGRLIRTDTDRGVTVVLDKRLRRPTTYREKFLGSLPGPPTILRPHNPDEAYAAIAAQLGRTYDDALRDLLDSFETADLWGSIRELTPDEALDSDAIRAKLEEVREKLGFSEWRPGQLEIMERFIRGEDVLAVMPTGSGKSVTFQIPALIAPGVTIVVSPLIALMRDQIENLRARGVTRVAGIYSGLSQTEQEEVLAGARSGRYKLIYVSPERLWSGRFRQALADVDIARVAVDEAHCISQWGHSFRPEYAAIPRALESICGGASRPAILAATATATPSVRDEIVQLLALRLTAEPVVRSPDRPELHYYVEECANFDERDLRVVEILEGLPASPVIVYVPRRADTTRLASMLRAANHAARPYHGAMAPEERLNVEESFRFGETDVVVATKAFGLGIDKPDIAAIVHLEMPASVEEYVQETGRAARGAPDGARPSTGYCVLLRAPRDCGIHPLFVRSAAPGIDVVRAVWEVVSSAPETLRPLEEIAAEIEAEDVNEETVSLGLHYLIEEGSIVRHADVMWAGRVWVPPDVDAMIEELERHRPTLAKQGRETVETIRRIGTEEYVAPTWARYLDTSPETLESHLLELNRSDVIGLTAWRFAVHLERASTSAPRWDVIERRCDDRRRAVKGLSDAAKRYAKESSTCRRAALLRYLGFDPPDRCDRCDVCDPNLARPWTSGSMRLEDLQQSLPTDAVIRAMLYEVGGRFSQRSIAHALAGSNGGGAQISPHLQEHRLFGYLSALGTGGVSDAVLGLVAAGQVEELTVELPGREPYPSWKLTPAGSGLI